jgi:Glycosyl transferase family 2
VVPVHNEAAHLDRSVECFLEALGRELPDLDSRLLLVENGSTDDTASVCRSLAVRHPGTVRVLTVPRGSYGEAVRTGLLASDGATVLILECDVLSVEFVRQSLASIGAGRADLVIGSKRHPDARDARPWARRFLTAWFNRLLRIATGYPGSDTHGLKTLTAGAARRLAEIARTTDEVFQTELVLNAWLTGLRVLEIPIAVGELRPTPIRPFRRVPKVWRLIAELRRARRLCPAVLPRRRRIAPRSWRADGREAPAIQPLWPWVVALGVAGVAVGRYLLATGPRDYVSDEGTYTYVGWAWSRGDWPYRQAWDHKGPVTYLVTMLRVLLLGTETRFLPVQEVLLGVLTAGCVAVSGYRLWGAFAGAVAAATSVLLWAGYPPNAGHMSTVGSAIGLCTALALALALRARERTRDGRVGAARLELVGAGVAGGLAFCTKPNALSGLALALLVVVILERAGGFRAALRRGALVGAGAVLPVAAFGVVFFRAGDLGSMLDVVFRFNSIRGALVLAAVDPATLLRRTLRTLHRYHVLWLTGAILGLTALLLVRRWLPRRWVPFRLDLIEWVVPAAVGFALVILYSNGSYPYHLYPAFVALALGAGWMVSVAGRLLPDRRWAASLAGALVLAPFLYGVARMSPARPRPAPKYAAVARWLERETGPADRIVAFTSWQFSGALTLAHRLSAVAFVYPIPLYTKGYASESIWARVAGVLDGPGALPVVLLSTWRLPLADSARPSVDELAQRLLDPLVPPALRGRLDWPSLRRTMTILTNHYRVASCLWDVCLLRATAPPDRDGVAPVLARAEPSPGRGLVRPASLEPR